ncbi:hypothetical protein LFYK43_01100 [Ligilactobacillus salitolerans]|uniref:L,D-TPase catalytic domain-containing protein n=1 Tax=Ligilactobacillus salitolerans TaxID=1808352 RepID=A0A401IQ43_9LACO|nr:L,D-transpeptidase family protein [Ligilactobacillus salitolerans]GBG93651.1 hypothetical protein LFYK43_01100 [Ligilactobacillus salitolerans]
MKANKKVWLLAGLALVAAACGGYYGWHATHFAKDTVVQGINISKMSYKEADAAIQKNLKEPSYALTDPQTHKTLYQGKLKIAANHAYRKELKELLHQRRVNPFSNESGQANQAKIYDQTAAKENLAQQRATIAQALNQTNQSRTAPQNARITVTNGQAQLTKAVDGNQIDTQKTLEQLTKSINPNRTGQQKVDVVLSKATWTGETEYQQLTKKMGQTFKYSVMGHTETGKVKDLLNSGTITDKGTNINLSPSYNFITKLNQKYSLSGSNSASFTTVQGNQVSFDNSQGTLGWAISEYTEGRYLQEQLLKGNFNVSAKSLVNNTQKYDKANLDDLKKTDHIEIDLTKEQLYLVQGNKVTQQMPVNTGSPKVNIATPTGYYYIKWRKAPMTMKGTEKDGTKYSSYVPQAMDLTDDGIFIHSAPWVAKATFGNPKVRYEKGSNGCINVAPAAMVKLFNSSHQGMPVIIYGNGTAS